MPHAIVIRAAGTNCDAEMVRAFELAGAKTQLVHLDRLIEDPAQIDRFDLIGFPGGFSYGDDVASGRIFAMRVRERLYPALRDAARRGCLMIGACNGFQVMVQVGLLPGPSSGEEWPEESAPSQSVALAHNANGMFIDRWVGIELCEGSRCIWTRGIAERFAPGERGDVLRLPIAHGEGRFVAASNDMLRQLESGGQIAIRYTEDVNGSAGGVAGVCDASGRIFALMPHPERYLSWLNHPYWTRLSGAVRERETPGMAMFRNAVEAAATVSI